MMVRESTLVARRNEIRVGTFALMRPVITSTEGRCVASTRWMPTARAICARRVIASSTLPLSSIIRSASSSIMMIMWGSDCSASLSSNRLGVWLSNSLLYWSIFLTLREASSFRRRSISRTALRNALAASFGSVIIGVNRWGMPSYMPSSTRLGSTRISLTCCGVALYSTDMIMALMATDLPLPVEPAIRTWGMVARSAVTRRPLMSLPMASVNFDLVWVKFSDSITSRSQIVSRSWLGTWMPTVLLPA